MNIKNKSKSSLNPRFLLASLIAFSLMIISGIIIGLIKQVGNFDLLVILIGALSALVYRRIAKDFSITVGILSVLACFFGLLIVECVANFGVEGLLVINNYGTLLNFVISEDLHRVSWSVYRLLALLIAYSYSRVV
ncbi:MAG TPA: hypothetical protein VJY11_02515 [Erysipelothrix sp.]|nr:hypothetical protein [Erysipelothrix sp.]